MRTNKILTPPPVKNKIKVQKRNGKKDVEVKREQFEEMA